MVLLMDILVKGAPMEYPVAPIFPAVFNNQKDDALEGDFPTKKN